jgi:flagellar basal body-associated protein FliL
MEFLRNALFVFIIGVVVVVVVVVVVMVIVVVLLSSARVLRPAHKNDAQKKRERKNTRFSRSKRTSLGRLTFHRSRVLLMNIKKHRRESE